jgi:hypothetical protein
MEIVISVLNVSKHWRVSGRKIGDASEEEVSLEKDS